MIALHTMGPLVIYLYFRVALLSGSLKFLRLFAVFGYASSSYIPAVLLTLIPVNGVKWAVIGVAFVN